MKMNTERLEKDFETLKQAIKDRLPEIDLEELKYNIQSGIQNIPQNLANGFKIMGDDIRLDLEEARNGGIPKHFVKVLMPPSIFNNAKGGHILYVPLLAYVAVVTLIGRYTEEANSIKEFEKREIAHRITDDNIQDVTGIDDFVMVNHEEEYSGPDYIDVNSETSSEDNQKPNKFIEFIKSIKFTKSNDPKPIEFYSAVLIDDEFEFEIVGDNNE